MTNQSGTKRRRTAAVLASFALAAAGTGWAGCGDDAEDEAQEAIDEVNKALEEADVEGNVEKVQEEVDKAIKEAQQQLEDQGY